MIKGRRILTVERPDSEAAVDFLSEGVSVELSVEDGKLRVVAKLSHGEDASSWDEREIEWDLPERSRDEEVA